MSTDLAIYLIFSRVVTALCTTDKISRLKIISASINRERSPPMPNDPALRVSLQKTLPSRKMLIGRTSAPRSSRPSQLCSRCPRCRSSSPAKRTSCASSRSAAARTIPRTGETVRSVARSSPRAACSPRRRCSDSWTCRRAGGTVATISRTDVGTEHPMRTAATRSRRARRRGSAPSSRGAGPS